MSTISDIYDEIYVLMDAAFPNKMELVNPYELTDNNEQILIDGYGIAWELGTDSDQIVKQIRVIDREFFFVSVRAYFSTDLNTTPKKTAEKLLFEDQLTSMKTLIAYTEQPSSPLSYVDDVQFIDDNGIEFVFSDEQRYLALRSRFRLRYQEKLF